MNGDRKGPGIQPRPISLNEVGRQMLGPDAKREITAVRRLTGIVPGSPSQLETISANLASLNEIVMELVDHVSDDPEFRTVVRDVLRQATWNLGFEFQGQPPS
jgi:hypothetical protein